MSVQLIQPYHAQVDKIIRYGGSRKETSVRKPFQDMLEAYARQKNLALIAALLRDILALGEEPRGLIRDQYHSNTAFHYET